MELRHLRYFVAVAEELHFRKAAERLHIVQPALSKQISLLEAELGVRLLDRDRRHVSLTSAGRAFLEDAQAVVSRADGAKARALAIGNGGLGEFSIGFIQPALADLVPRSLRRFRDHYPEVTIRISEMPSKRAIDEVANRTIHCAFTRLPVPDRPDISHEVVSRQEVVLAVPDSHRLAGQESVELIEVAGDDLIFIDRRVERELHDYYVAACSQAGFSPQIAHRVNSTSIAIGLVASGLGICFVPASAALHPQHGISLVRIRSDPPRLTIGLIWNDKAIPSVLANFLVARPWESETSA